MINFRIRGNWIYCRKGRKTLFKVSNNINNASNLLWLLRKQEEK